VCWTVVQGAVLLNSGFDLLLVGNPGRNMFHAYGVCCFWITYMHTHTIFFASLAACFIVL